MYFTSQEDVTSLYFSDYFNRRYVSVRSWSDLLESFQISSTVKHWYIYLCEIFFAYALKALLTIN